jgi:hypothetical protein
MGPVANACAGEDLELEVGTLGEGVVTFALEEAVTITGVEPFHCW